LKSDIVITFYSVHGEISRFTCIQRNSGAVAVAVWMRVACYFIKCSWFLNEFLFTTQLGKSLKRCASLSNCRDNCIERRLTSVPVLFGCTNHLTAIKVETQAPRFRGEMYAGREDRESAAVRAALSSSRSGSARIGAVRSR
jgi:hypothetical protein